MSFSNSLPVYIVDAFTNSAFGGNPAAVCLLDAQKSDAWLQKVAAEFNLSETAFLLHEHENRWNLRWFTPTCEVNLCGHATLASAHTLISELNVNFSELIFSSLSGDLKAKIEGNFVILDFPRITTLKVTEIPEMISALNIKYTDVYLAGEDFIIEVASEQEVRCYEPEIAKIAQIKTRGIILTAPSESNERDFVSRFFAPRAGIDEDPVTGSAHCSLGDLWSKKLNKNQLRAEQVSARKGILGINVYETRVELSGQCVTFLKGEILNNR